jgi:uncharacterized protein with PQ loop repeat
MEAHKSTIQQASFKRKSFKKEIAMTREEYAQKIGWPKIMFWAGLLNPLALVPQLYSIASTGNVSGVSLPMLGLFLIIQISFTLNGFFQRDKAVMISMGASVPLTTSIIVLVLLYR